MLHSVITMQHLKCCFERLKLKEYHQRKLFQFLTYSEPESGFSSPESEGYVASEGRVVDAWNYGVEVHHGTINMHSD